MHNAAEGSTNSLYFESQHPSSSVTTYCENNNSLSIRTKFRRTKKLDVENFVHRKFVRLKVCPRKYEKETHKINFGEFTKFQAGAEKVIRRKSMTEKCRKSVLLPKILVRRKFFPPKYFVHQGGSSS